MIWIQRTQSEMLLQITSLREFISSVPIKIPKGLLGRISIKISNVELTAALMLRNSEESCSERSNPWQLCVWEAEAELCKLFLAADAVFATLRRLLRVMSDS